MKLDSYLIPQTKTNSKWIKKLNGIAKIIKLLLETIAKKLHGIGFGIGFPGEDTRLTGNKGKKRYLDYIEVYKPLRIKEHNQQE